MFLRALNSEYNVLKSDDESVVSAFWMRRVNVDEEKRSFCSTVCVMRTKQFGIDYEKIMFLLWINVS